MFTIHFALYAIVTSINRDNLFHLLNFAPSHASVKHRLNTKSLIVLFALLSLTAAQRPRPPITIGQCPVTGANNPDFDLEHSRPDTQM